MTSKERASLKELQSLDIKLRNIGSTIDNFEVELEELEAPTLKLGQEIEGLGKRPVSYTHLTLPTILLV